MDCERVFLDFYAFGAYNNNRAPALSPLVSGTFLFMKITPLGNNILIEPLEREDKLPSGLVIPDTAKEKPQEGKVVAVGPGKYEDGELVKPSVKVGSRVLYKRYGGDEIRVGDKEYLVVDAEDVLAVIQNG